MDSVYQEDFFEEALLFSSSPACKRKRTPSTRTTASIIQEGKRTPYSSCHALISEYVIGFCAEKPKEQVRCILWYIV